MREYETFVFLDVQKTGTTFIHAFLKKFSCEKLVCFRKHKGMPMGADRSKYHFISVRNPFDLYMSLYSYGCDSYGKLALKLNNKGRGELYDRTWGGFETWLDFVLDPENGSLLGDNYGGPASNGLSELIGFQSFRVLTMALPGGTRLLKGCDSTVDLQALYEEKKLPKHAIKTESLREDLKDLVLHQLSDRFRNLGKAILFIDTEEAINASQRIDRWDTGRKLNKPLQNRLEQREWFLHTNFKY